MGRHSVRGHFNGGRGFFLPGYRRFRVNVPPFGGTPSAGSTVAGFSVTAIGIWPGERQGRYALRRPKALASARPPCRTIRRALAPEVRQWI